MVIPNLIGRSQGLIDFSLRSDPLVASYQFNAAMTLQAAFGGGTAAFTVGRGRTLESLTIRRTGRGKDASSLRGLTRVSIDLNDYASATIPGDAAMSFWNVQEVDQAGTVLNPGPVLVVPPTQTEGFLTLSGTAPSIAATTSGLPPVGAMAIAFPREVTALTIYNDDAVNALSISTSASDPEVLLPSSTVAGSPSSFIFQPASFSMLYLHGTAGTISFRLTAFMPGGPPR